MGKKTKLTLTLLAAILFGAGFAVGKSVQAENPAPGSVGDPLVSQNYVRTQVEKKNQELQAKIKTLQDKITVLEARVKEFETQAD